MCIRCRACEYPDRCKLEPDGDPALKGYKVNREELRETMDIEPGLATRLYPSPP